MAEGAGRLDEGLGMVNAECAAFAREAGFAFGAIPLCSALGFALERMFLQSHHLLNR